MQRSERHETIIRYLRRNHGTTLQALCSETGAARRTVLRDIASLRDQGFIIQSEVGRGGGVRLDPSSVQTTARLAVPEVFALLITVAAQRATQPIPFSDLADSALAKIERALPTDKLRDLRAFLECLYIGELPAGQDISQLGPIDPTLLPVFEAGFLNQTPIGFDYRDAKGHVTSRTVEPQAMLILPPLWYIVAWDPARDGFRHFRMDRIDAPAVCDGPRFRRRHVPFNRNVQSYTGLVPQPAVQTD
ncbi:helix-turn-helix transcriptional regulator [Roseibaca sp. Y0-43]|uniref:helix-turn-helix transcriptional regulator n=1 Tax=Roseibaca sp. Y0-43 TaxID=2816854 RepID=UPI001D0C6FEC|nr:WYL domain-containing protein [Roseibaca sp. Y0-43]MCC1481943.1 WYL domain-containing protein [Roseibaca sp. Y0-43]